LSCANPHGGKHVRTLTRSSLAALALMALMAGTAAAQMPPYTQSGARPGNDIGTGMSLPRSDTAGNINSATTHSVLAPNLPVPGGPQTIRDLLLAARSALAGNRTGEAQEALERAETRALDRDIPAGTERIPAGGGLIAGISQARDALGNHNAAGAIAIIDGLLRQ
jgi:hypothetical protein